MSFFNNEPLYNCSNRDLSSCLFIKLYRKLIRIYIPFSYTAFTFNCI